MTSRNSRRATQSLEEPLPNISEPDAPPQVNEVAQHTTSTELVDLPSQGRFYPKGHPLNGKGSVEIRYMTARDEDILTSPSLLRKGLAVDRFIESIIVTPGVTVDDLLIGDKSAIMIAARITGYGPDYSATITCPSCNTEYEEDFDLNEYEKYFVPPEDDSITTDSNGNFSITLPISGHEVKLKLLTSKDEARMNKAREMKSKNKLQESLATDFLKSIIVAIDGDSNPVNIAQIVPNIPARDTRHLRNTYSSMVPSVQVLEDVECQYCGAESEMEVPLEANFFWPNS